jgi:hypothetical protein
MQQGYCLGGYERINAAKKRLKYLLILGSFPRVTAHHTNRNQKSQQTPSQQASKQHPNRSKFHWLKGWGWSSFLQFLKLVIALETD